ncbi:hypothetical protein AB0759_40050 [Scytonema tolypothrichoides VB-61278_2]|uniref:Uncharacterized protein n=2 Tax=Nostocales TaxID=1161 RepID=A0A8S9TC25_9CYAN|nr:hypothetical protein [Tolypothrix bouteillei]KAF3888983.1 hypothetical protein DA73_0400028495 [Tolypothrix bouteillei VB521301]
MSGLGIPNAADDTRLGYTPVAYGRKLAISPSGSPFGFASPLRRETRLQGWSHH